MNGVASASGTVTLVDGMAIPFRPIVPSDREALQRFHARLSDRSIYQRFFCPKPRLGDADARYFTAVDDVDRVALVALDPRDRDEIIGVVRFDRDPGAARAEYAAVIADTWQGHGLGPALTRRLIDEARRRGIRSLYALVLPDNLRMLHLLRDLGLPERVRDLDGVEQIDVDLREAGA